MKGAPYWSAFFLFVATLALGRRIQRYAVTGESMLPTLQPGDWLVADRFAYRRRAPEPGDVVIVLHPETGQSLVKRIGWIEDGHAFVLGDNGVASTDSRTFGPVPSNLVVARVLWRYWPAPWRGHIPDFP